MSKINLPGSQISYKNLDMNNEHKSLDWKLNELLKAFLTVYFQDWFDGYYFI